MFINFLFPLFIYYLIIIIDGRSAKKKESDSLGTDCDSNPNAGIHSFSIKGDSPNGEIVQYNVLYNETRGLPISTTAYHDSINHIKKAKRENNFRKYDCPQLASEKVQLDCAKSYKMTPEQKQISGKSSYDRGHITPASPFTYNEDAVSKTFYCVNMAPQDPFTNQGPWRLVEHSVQESLKAGFVMTGVCNDDSAEGGILAGTPIPSCYWKLVCYKEGDETSVVGFIGDNGLIPKGDKKAKKQRYESTGKPRSQWEVIERSGVKEMIERGWQEAEKNLLDKREKDLAPNGSDCIKAKELNAKEQEKWEELINKTKKSDPGPSH